MDCEGKLFSRNIWFLYMKLKRGLTVTNSCLTKILDPRMGAKWLSMVQKQGYLKIAQNCKLILSQSYTWSRREIRQMILPECHIRGKSWSRVNVKVSKFQFFNILPWLPYSDFANFYQGFSCNGHNTLTNTPNFQAR